MNANAADVSPESRLQSASDLHIWREVLVATEWLRLRVSGIYAGHDIPHGDGSPVILIPGFLCSDRFLREFRRWLKRIGYKPYESRMGRNVECPELLVQHVSRVVEEAHAETGKQVHIVGHSLGGTIARTVAARHPGRVAQIIGLGSPVQSARAHPAILAAAEVVRRKISLGNHRPDACYTDDCLCGFASTAGDAPPDSVARTAIYSKEDNVVDWRCCLEDQDHMNIEVQGTHLGLAFNPDVYRTVAQLLARHSASARQRDQAASPAR
jgi:pimeloyl-ACP methyl ester carboxylesterase